MLEFSKELLPEHIKNDVHMQLHAEEKQVQVSFPPAVNTLQASKTFRFESSPQEAVDVALAWILQYLHQNL